MTNPISARTQTPNVAPSATPASATAVEQPSREAVLESEISRVDSARTARPNGSNARLNLMARTLEAAYRNGPAAFDTFLTNHPQILQELGRTSPDQLERALDHINSSKTGQILEQVQTRVTGQLRLHMVQHARRQINRQVGELRQLQNDVINNLDVYRNAQPGSAKALIADALGVRGDAGDAGRVREVIDRAVQGFHNVLERFHGQTWALGDFWQTAGRVAHRNGFGHGGNTFAGQAMRESNMAGRVHTSVERVEIGHIALETGHAAHVGWHAGAEVAAHSGLRAGVMAGLEAGAVALAPVAVGLAGLAFGIAVHHEVERQHEQFRALASHVGIR